MNLTFRDVEEWYRDNGYQLVEPGQKINGCHCLLLQLPNMICNVCQFVCEKCNQNIDWTNQCECLEAHEGTLCSNCCKSEITLL